MLKKTENELKFTLEGEGHTFCNLLQNVLIEDHNVEIAGYDLPHPLTKHPVIYLRTLGKVSPEKALEKALEKIRERATELSKKFDKEMEAKSYEK
ncbi:MAG: DNA-directed RNA polymerase subunit L [Candidatus Bathyarchaeia archaeon]